MASWSDSMRAYCSLPTLWRKIPIFMFGCFLYNPRRRAMNSSSLPSLTMSGRELCIPLLVIWYGSLLVPLTHPMSLHSAKQVGNGHRRHTPSGQFWRRTGSPTIIRGELVCRPLLGVCSARDC
ncbi:hypothetical protein F5Y03DRAFT_371060 [Xylaria venustula]|nr:hypothetical protein F5Y03DRAFT_371060 [Xylaria venustula]